MTTGTTTRSNFNNERDILLDGATCGLHYLADDKSR